MRWRWGGCGRCKVAALRGVCHGASRGDVAGPAGPAFDALQRRGGMTAAGGLAALRARLLCPEPAAKGGGAAVAAAITTVGACAEEIADERQLRVTVCAASVRRCANEL